MRNGRWEVLFGRLTSAKDTFFAYHHAVRVPRLPELVATEHLHFEVHTDGTISWRRAEP